MPRPKTSTTKTDAQRRAQNAYQYKNSTVVGCKLDRETAERYKAHCAELGTTPNAEIKNFILAQLGETSDKMRARMEEINAGAAEELTGAEAASLAAAEAMDDGTTVNIRDYIKQTER